MGHTCIQLISASLQQNSTDFHVPTTELKISPPICSLISMKKYYPKTVQQTDRNFCLAHKQFCRFCSCYTTAQLLFFILNEPCHEIMAPSVLHKFVLQICVCSQPSTRARCLFFCWTLCLISYLMCANSQGYGKTARMHRLAGAFAGPTCGKCHNLRSWLKLLSLFFWQCILF